MRNKLIAFSFLSLLAFTGPSVAGEREPVAALPGKYKCSFATSSAGLTFKYPDFACVIRKDGGHLELEKLSGSQRIRGKISPTANGFLFSGLYFCPYGDCDADVAGEFKRVDKGAFRGVIQNRNDPADVTIVSLKAER